MLMATSAAGRRHFSLQLYGSAGGFWSNELAVCRFKVSLGPPRAKNCDVGPVQHCSTVSPIHSTPKLTNKELWHGAWTKDRTPLASPSFAVHPGLTFSKELWRRGCTKQGHDCSTVSPIGSTPRPTTSKELCHGAYTKGQDCSRVSFAVHTGLMSSKELTRSVQRTGLFYNLILLTLLTPQAVHPIV